MTPPKSKAKPHLAVVDTTVPRDHAGRGYCRECGLAIRQGDPRHTLPDAPEGADHGQRAAGEGVHG